MKLSNEEIESRRIKSVETYNEIQEENLLDQFIIKNGPCCAACDHWHYHSPAILGECQKSNIMGTEDRLALLGITGWTGPKEPGRALTRRGDHCANFIDSDLTEE